MLKFQVIVEFDVNSVQKDEILLCDIDAAYWFKVVIEITNFNPVYFSGILLNIQQFDVCIVNT